MVGEHVIRPPRKDEEKDTISVLACTDDKVHVFRNLDDNEFAPHPVCGEDVVPTWAKLSDEEMDEKLVCEPCGVWMLGWAGSPDPKAEWEQRWGKLSGPEGPREEG